MVKLQVTGANSYNWIATKYNPNGQYDASCVTAFSERCFEGTDADETTYLLELVASNQGK